MEPTPTGRSRPYGDSRQAGAINPSEAAVGGLYDLLVLAGHRLPDRGAEHLATAPSPEIEGGLSTRKRQFRTHLALELFLRRPPARGVQRRHDRTIGQQNHDAFAVGFELSESVFGELGEPPRRSGCWGKPRRALRALQEALAWQSVGAVGAVHCERRGRNVPKRRGQYVPAGKGQKELDITARAGSEPPARPRRPNYSLIWLAARGRWYNPRLRSPRGNPISVSIKTGPSPDRAPGGAGPTSYIRRRPDEDL